VVEAHLRYRGEVHYDDLVRVKVWVSELKRAAMKFEYQVVNESTNAVATEGYTWHVVMNPKTRRAVSIPEFMRDLVERDPDLHETVD
jgi:acyl-CoA thioester hydrolase